MTKKLSFAVLACIILSACITEDDRLQKSATANSCGRMETVGRVSVYELPSEDLGNGNVGLYTFASRGDGPEMGRYSMVNCTSTQITRIEENEDPAEFRTRIEILRKAGATTSPETLASAARSVSGLRVVEGTAGRQDPRVQCACVQHYPEKWRLGDPPGPDGYRPVYLPPTLLPVSY